MIRISFPFFSPDDGLDIGDIGSDKDVLDENDDVKDEDDKDEDNEDEGDGEEDNDDTKDDGDDETEDKEDKEDEDDEKDDKEKEDDEDEEDKDDVKLSTITDIKKEYPDFFKKFPDIRASLFREEKYNSLFSNPEDAEEAVDKAAVLDKINIDLIDKGDPTELLKTLSGQNKESFEKVAFSILPWLEKNNKDLFYAVAAVPIKQLCRAAWREGKGKETNLGKAAAYIHDYFFGHQDIDKSIKGEGKIQDDEKSDKEKEYERKLKEIDDRDTKNFTSSIDTSYVKRMTDHIRERLDRDERLNEYMKTNLVNDILLEIRDTLLKDKKYTGTLSNLYKNAKANSYSSDFKSRIISTALARAKSLAPDIRKRLVAKALGRKEKKEKKDDDTKVTRKSSNSSNKDNKRQVRNDEPKKPLTDIDILNEP